MSALRSRSAATSGDASCTAKWMKQDRGDLQPMIAQLHPGDDARAARAIAPIFSSHQAAPSATARPKAAAKRMAGLVMTVPGLATIPTAQLLPWATVLLRQAKREADLRSFKGRWNRGGSLLAQADVPALILCGQ
jgi:hypothetical protein